MKPSSGVIAVLLLLAAAVAAPSAAAAASPPRPRPAPPRRRTRPPFFSNLWGVAGGRFNPAGRITDWSRAGYAGGSAPIPLYPVRFNVRWFGAFANGTDDGPAFQRAINAAAALAGPGNGVAVVVPKGNYTIRTAVTITSSYVVLRGHGVGRTILYMPAGLQAVYGQARAWAFGGGFVGIAGSNPSTYRLTALATITANANRGARRLQVNSTAPFRVGQWYKLGLRMWPALPPPPSPPPPPPPPAPHPPPPSTRRRLQAFSASLPSVLSGLFSNPALQTAAMSAAEGEWGVPRPGGVGVAQAGPGLKQMPALLVAAAKYAAAGALSHWVDEVGPQAAAAQLAGASGSAVGAAMASPGSLDAYLYGNNLVDSGTPSMMFPRNDRLRFPFRVTAVGPGWIDIDRPLPIDLQTRWQPAIYAYAPTVQHSGIEDFTFEFKWDTYPDHLDAKGYNAIGVYDTANTWVRNIHIVDCTSGVFTGGTEFVTVQKISFEVTKPRGTGSMRARGVEGHHALMMSHGAFNLLTDFRLPQSRYYHDVSVDSLLHLSVVRNGAAQDMNLDTHRAATHNNLFTNLDTGRGLRPWDSGGHQTRGAYSAANTTWWGIFASNQGGFPSPRLLPLPPCTHGPLLNWVGQFDTTVRAGACAAQKWTVEQTGPRFLLEPADLFAAQRAWRRLQAP